MTKTAHRLQPISLGAALTAILCAVIWAGQSIAVKVALIDFPVNTMMALRFLLPVPLFFAVARFKGISLTPKGVEWKAMAVNATLLCTQIALFTYGTDGSYSTSSIILINTFPFFAALAGHFFLAGHGLTRRIALGITVAFLGLPILFATSTGGTDYSWSGKALILGAAVVMGIKVIFMKRTLGSLHPLKLASWDVAAAAIVFSVLAAITDNLGEITPHAHAIWGLAYQAWIVSFAGFVLWLTLLAKHSANHLNVFRLLTPPIGVALGGLILDEPLNYQLVICALFVTLGLYLVLTTSRNTRPSHPSSSSET